MKKLLNSMILLGLLAGCNGPREISYNIENIRVLKGVPSANCRFIANISNPSVHEKIDLKSSQEALNTDDNHYLKEQGMKLGANVIILTSHNSKFFMNRYVRNNKIPQDIYTHSISGKAYYCSSVSNSIPQPHLDIQQTPLSKNEDVNKSLWE